MSKQTPNILSHTLAIARNWIPAFAGMTHRKTVIQFLKFGTVGVVGFIVDTAFLYIGIGGLSLSRVAAGFFSFPFAVTVTWFGNRIFTFREIDHEPMAKQWTKFAVVCAIGIVFNRGTYSLLVSTIPFVFDYPVIGLLAGTAAGMFFNFFASRKLVFARKIRAKVN
jgi:putative flippase GtrA